MFLSVLRKVLHRLGPARARRRRGATAMEYLAVISFIFIAALSAINFFGQTTKEKFQENSDAIENATKDKGQSGP
jgi:Flp pilus assembly pilin Flp